MDASLDTDIIIHLYKSGKENLLFSFCDKLYIHEYLLENELKRNSYGIYDKFLRDKEDKNIQVICNSDLADMGIKSIFYGYIEKYEYLFDDGELYAVALAKAMGIVTFLSDDTKDFGPHETLLKELIEDVIPFAFYELLFLKYIESDLTPENLHLEFEEITSKSMAQRPMNFRSRMLRTVRRFSKKRGRERDIKWIIKFCKDRKIDFNSKMLDLKRYLIDI